MKEKEIKLVEAFSGLPMEAQLLKSMLENAGIISFIKDENMGSIAPWFTSPGGAGAVKVIVNNQDLKTAQVIVEQFEQSRNEG